MATMKTFNTAGTSTQNGITKVRFGNDYVNRFKILVKNGHEDIQLIELGGDYSKAEVCKILMSHADFQSEDQQSVIADFVVRNCDSIAAELEEAAQDCFYVLQEMVRGIGFFNQGALCDSPMRSR